MANRDDIKSIIGYMALAYQNFHPDLTSIPNTIDIFEDLLGDLEADVLRAAVKQACREPRAFAPAPGEIRAVANSLPVMRDPFATLTKYLEAKNVKTIGKLEGNTH